MLFARYQSRLLVWLASLSLLVAFVGAMTVQFIGGRACWKPRRVFPTKPVC
jgi:Na+/pantothenate symporter